MITICVAINQTEGKIIDKHPDSTFYISYGGTLVIQRRLLKYEESIAAYPSGSWSKAWVDEVIDNV